MRISLNILLLIFTLISSKALPCDCAISKSLKATQDREFENSECIFIGEVLEINSEKDTFKVMVIESFNGDENGIIYDGKFNRYCEPIIDEKGKWLIYGNFNSDNLIEINYCGLTRSFKNPQNNISASKPPPPLPPNAKKSKSQTEKERYEWKLRAKTDLENEIIDLRKRIE